MAGSDFKPAVSARAEATRGRVLDAAERLLREGKADFSMRDLAPAAGVSFATPFNQFGSKASIMHALSRRRIDAMAALFAASAPLPTAADRVALAMRLAAQVMLDEPAVNRAVMGSIGAATHPPGEVLAQSSALWVAALGRGEGLAADRRDAALHLLPRQLAFGFRGVLSFWSAGELADAALADAAAEIGAALLAGWTA
jgi:AcrR family transcriptional regulator